VGEVFWRKDGTSFPVDYTGTAMLDDNHRPVGAVVVFRDVTDLRKTEKELGEHREHLEELIQVRTAELSRLSQAIKQSPVSVVITDRDAIIEYVNPIFTEICGYTAEEARGKNPRILQSGEHTKEFYQGLWKTLMAGNAWNGEFHNKRKDGSLYWESACISPLRDDKGEITHYGVLSANSVKISTFRPYPAFRH
jgi:PAS domain S-box-containing protein